MYHILYVDDEPDLLEIGKLFLEKGGQFSVDIQTSASAGLMLLSSANYDAIVSDYQMPEMDGIEFLKKVRTSGSIIPFILFTGRGREEVVIQALNEGADFYLQKGGEPVAQFTELVHHVRQAIQQRQAEVSIRDHERREADIINFLPDATFAIDTNGVVIAWNRAMEEMTGVTAAGMLGKGNYEYAIPIYHERRPVLIDLVLHEDPAIVAKYPDIERDGQTLIAEATSPHLYNGKGATIWFTASPLCNNQGIVVGAIESIRDITERKRAEDALRESEERYRTLVASVNEAIILQEKTGEILTWNKAAERLFGVTAREVLGHTATSRKWRTIREDGTEFPDSEHPSVHTLATGEACKNVVMGITSAEGRFSWVNINTSPLFGQGDAKPYAVVISLLDITERKQEEEDAKKAHEELAASYEQITAVDKELRQTLDQLTQHERNLRESEEKYRTVFENTGTATVVVEENGIISLANAEFAQFSGFFKEDIEGKKSWTEFVAKDDLERMLAQHRLRRQDREKALTHYEFQFVTKSGDIRSIYLSIDIIPGTKKSIASLLDITERKQAEAALKKSKERYRNVVEDQTEFICRFLPDGTHIFVNDAYCRYFDKKREEIIGHRFRPVLHPEDREIVARHIASLTPQHPVMNIDQRIIMPDSSTRWQRWSDRAIFDPSGTITEYQSVGRDITERKRAEEALRQANKKLTLLSGITRHDINNQITKLMGFLRILEKKQPDTRFAEYFQKINASAQRISAMIRFTKDCEKIGVHAPVWEDSRTLVGTAAKEAPLGKVMVKNDLPAGTEVFADPLIVKVFFNLMDNAVRYGGKITTIRFTVQESGDDHLIVCEDDGEGIPAEEKERVFERGFGKNTGLGLFLAREILSITGITIRETGEPGKGARFEMTVPKGAFRLTDVQ